MKTMTKLTALGVLAVSMVAGLQGCAEDNDKASLAPVAGGVSAGKPVTPPGTPSSSSAAQKQMEANNPMTNNKGYRPQ